MRAYSIGRKCVIDLDRVESVFNDQVCHFLSIRFKNSHDGPLNIHMEDDELNEEYEQLEKSLHNISIFR